MKGWVKKLAMILGIAASLLVISSSAKMLFNNETESPTTNGSETAVVAVVAE